MYKESLAAIALCVIIALGAVVLVEVHHHPQDVPAPPVMIAEARAQPEAQAQKTPVKAAYVGNTNTHRFHKLPCRYAGCPNCKARFATRDEAIAAGYRPCGTCDP